MVDFIYTSISQFSLRFLQINFQTSTAMIFKHEHALEFSRGLAKTEINGPTLRASGSTGLEWTQGICVSKELPDIAGALGPPATL